MTPQPYDPHQQASNLTHHQAVDPDGLVDPWCAKCGALWPCDREGLDWNPEPPKGGYTAEDFS